MCCMFCSNIVSQNNRLDVHDATNTLLTIAETDDSKWRARGDQLLWASHDRLETIAGSSTKAELQRVQQAMGLNHNPKGLLGSRLLAPSSVTMYDWMLFGAWPFSIGAGTPHSDVLWCWAHRGSNLSLL